MGHLSLLPVCASALARKSLRIAALAALLGLAACGGGSDDPPPAGGGATPPPAAASAPAIATQPAAQSVTAPASASFSVTAGGTAPLAYQWRSSANGTDWTAISGATGASYDTGATDVGMNGRWYSVVVSNGAGSVTSDSARLTVQAAAGGGGGGGAGPSGEFPHAANPFAVAVTPAESAVAGFGVGSSTDAAVQVPDGAADVAVSGGVTVSFGFPGNTFLEGQWLAVTPVTLAAADAAHPLPFQSVAAAFDLAPADPAIPELRTSNLVRVTFTLTQAAVDALGGQPVIFSARSDGTQLHLLPVFANEDGSWSTLTLTTHAGHLGIFGIAGVSDAQAAALAAAWPSYDDFQLEAALAPPLYGMRKAALAAQPAAAAVRARPLKKTAADADPVDWAAQRQARLEAYYNDVVVPALNAANAANADLAQFRDATEKLLSWERERQLAGFEDAGVMQELIDLAQRGLAKAMEDCATSKGVAATVQALGMVRQVTLLGGETDLTVPSVLGACGGGSFDVSVSFNQVHTTNYTRVGNADPAVAYTEPVQIIATASGKLHLTGSVPELSAMVLDYSLSDDKKCADGAVFCTSRKVTITAHETAPALRLCASAFWGSFRVVRWNLDARGHYSTPLLEISFVNATGCGQSSFILETTKATQTDASGSTSTTTANDWVDTVPWSGTAGMGTSSRIVRRSSPVTGQNIDAGGTERWTTSLSFTVTELKPGN